MAMTEQELAATSQGQSTVAHHAAGNRCMVRCRAPIQLNTGLKVAFAPENAQGLEAASSADLTVVEIDPSGFGIRFPRFGCGSVPAGAARGILGSKT